MKLWKKILLMIGAILLMTVGAATAYLTTVLNSTTTAFKSTYTSAGSTGDTMTAIKATKPLTILLMGVDTGGAGRGTADSWEGNSDSQILLTLNPETKTATMVSLERDTMTNILDTHENIVSTQKMNAAYAQGFSAGGLDHAAGYSMKTIASQIGVPIDNFVIVNFDGLVNLVDDVGGIDVVNDSGSDLYIYDTEPQYTDVVKQGKQHINGAQALVYARDRHHMANGDYGRTAHQREVISQLMSKLVSINNISQYQKFLSDASKDFKTNIEITGPSLLQLLAYRDCFQKVVSLQYQGVDYTNPSDGGSYQLIPTDVSLAVQNAIKLSLGQSTSSELDKNVISYENYSGGASDFYYMPSATVTENKKSTVYGLDTDGKLVSITSENANKFASTIGGSVADAGQTSGTKSKSSSTSSSESTQADPNYTADTATQGQGGAFTGQ